MLLHGCPHRLSVPRLHPICTLRDQLRRQIRSLSAARRAAPSRLHQRSVLYWASAVEGAAAENSPVQPPSVQEVSLNHLQSLPSLPDHECRILLACTTRMKGNMLENSPASNGRRSKDLEGLRLCIACKTQRLIRHFKKSRAKKVQVVNYAAVCGGCEYKRKLTRKLMRTEARDLTEAENEVERLVGIQPDQHCSCCHEQLPASFFSLDPSDHQCRTCLTEKAKAAQATKDYPAAAEKECSVCSKMLLSNKFRRDKTNSTGLSSRCNSCDAAGSKVYFASIKVAPLLPSSPPPAKICTSCAEMKPLTEFAVHSGSAAGHVSICRLCKSTYDRLRWADTKSVVEPTAATS